MAKLYVRNFPWETTENDLVEFFNDAGFQAVKAQIIIDAETKKSKGFGFVQLQDETENDEAINALNEQNFNGRTLVVNHAKPPQARPQSERY